jgi:hypothetical protein
MDFMSLCGRFLLFMDRVAPGQWELVIFAMAPAKPLDQQQEFEEFHR